MDFLKSGLEPMIVIIIPIVPTISGVIVDQVWRISENQIDTLGRHCFHHCYAVALNYLILEGSDWLHSLPVLIVLWQENCCDGPISFGYDPKLRAIRCFVNGEQSKAICQREIILF